MPMDVHTIPGEWSGLANTERGHPYSLCTSADESSIHKRGDGPVEVCHYGTKLFQAIAGRQQKAAPGRYITCTVFIVLYKS